MKNFVERRYTRLAGDISLSYPLAEHPPDTNYVLLGEPGCGKTTAFQHEAGRTGGYYITARDFIALELESGWQKPLFIDGLDEVRSGAEPYAHPLDEIRQRLQRLHSPRFRLSCRSMDWRGDPDLKHLQTVAEGAVHVLCLEPLQEADIETIVASRIPDPATFIHRARQEHIYPLLQNPQFLELFLQAVSWQEDWPKSRKKIFELACHKMACETNEAHESVRNTDELLNAAGYLCAIQLISGIAGFATSAGAEQDDYPQLSECNGHTDHLREALKTRFFVPAGPRVVPVHRHIAEYLAALYLCGKVRSGLSTRRILALLTGFDGMVVGKMSALCAWLATHCTTDNRAAAMLVNPLGACIYGDPSQYSVDEKKRLLKNLQQHHASLSLQRQRSGSISFPANFLVPELEPLILRSCADPSRTYAQQCLVDLLLDLLRQPVADERLQRLPLHVASDHSWLPFVRRTALYVYIENQFVAGGMEEGLMGLLREIRAGKVADPEYELYGILLKALYPQVISASEIWNELVIPERRCIGGKYYNFWHIHLVEDLSDAQLQEHLDALVESIDRLRQSIERNLLYDVLLHLLDRGLRSHGDKLQTTQLFNWLGIVSAWQGQLDAGNGAVERIRTWLGERPDRQKELILLALSGCTGADNINAYRDKITSILYSAHPPSDYGAWCLQQALRSTNIAVARYFLEEAYRRCSSEPELSVALLAEKVQSVPALHAHLEELRRQTERDSRAVKELVASRKRASGKQYQGLQDLIRKLRSEQAALQENRGSAGVLYTIACVYYGAFTDIFGSSAQQRLHAIHGEDTGLRSAIYSGLKGAVARADVPEARDIIRKAMRREHFVLELPCLAGAEELYRETTALAGRLNIQQLRSVIAFWLVSRSVGVLAQSEPGWYPALVGSRPELVSDVIIQLAREAVKSGFDYIPALDRLAFQQDHAAVAAAACIPLLRSFPVRCTTVQRQHLDTLLRAAFANADRQVLLCLVKTKLSRKSMDVAQRVRWLAAGFLLDRESFQQRLHDHLQTSDARRRHLLECIMYFDDEVFKEPLDVRKLETLIQHSGALCRPELRDHRQTNMAAARTADLIHGMIRGLAGLPDNDARESLNRLQKNEALSAWHTELEWAGQQQHVILREQSYKHPGIAQLREALRGGAPANVADLFAHVRDAFDAIKITIENGNTDDYRQYWNEGDGRSLQQPKHEASCRDALLSALRHHLQYGNAEPEGRYARDTRADISVSFAELRVPVEIKKNTHRELWTALRTRLIPKYSRDPGAASHGIYLVLWFGVAGSTRSPSGARPQSAAGLQKCLQSGLSHEESTRIAVQVIDVSGGT